MKAWNRKHKPKHWTKPKWHYRKYYADEEVFVLANRKAKQKGDFWCCEVKILTIQIRIIGDDK